MIARTRRNPVWGTLDRFSSLTSAGFTGHESDGELGLVNMKGRMYDPRSGASLTMDPLVRAPISGQSWNPYSYVFNNPLSHVDQSGFEGDKPPIMPIGSTERVNPDGSLDVTITYPPRQPPKEDPKESGEQVGAFVPPVDVSTLGSSSGLVAQPVTTAPTSWTQHPLVQLEGGFLGGLFLGLVPFAGVGQQLLDVTGVLPKGTPEETPSGAGDRADRRRGVYRRERGGGGGRGRRGEPDRVGALIGVPVVVGSATAVVGGIGNMAAGVRGLAGPRGLGTMPRRPPQGRQQGRRPRSIVPPSRQNEKPSGRQRRRIIRRTIRLKIQPGWKKDERRRVQMENRWSFIMWIEHRRADSDQ